LFIITANDAKRDFGELLLSAQREPVKISSSSFTKDKKPYRQQLFRDAGRSCNEIYPNGFYFPVGKHTTYFTKEDGFILVVDSSRQVWHKGKKG
jgi:toxin ParE1/3/4